MFPSSPPKYYKNLEDKRGDDSIQGRWTEFTVGEADGSRLNYLSQPEKFENPVLAVVETNKKQVDSCYRRSTLSNQRHQVCLEAAVQVQLEMGLIEI